MSPEQTSLSRESNFSQVNAVRLSELEFLFCFSETVAVVAT